MELNTDYIQLALCIKYGFDFGDELNQINDLSNYKRFDLNPNYFRLDLI